MQMPTAGGLLFRGPFCRTNIARLPRAPQASDSLPYLFYMIHTHGVGPSGFVSAHRILRAYHKHSSALNIDNFFKYTNMPFCNVFLCESGNVYVWMKGDYPVMRALLSCWHAFEHEDCFVVLIAGGHHPGLQPRAVHYHSKMGQTTGYTSSLF
jgi:hypothetical protein